jgi:stage III sporulation protein AB
LEALCDRLLYSAQPLAALWQSFATDAVLSDYPLVQDTASELCKGIDFYASFSRAVEKAAVVGQLTPTQAALLTELGGSLGHSGLEQQAHLIRHCAERLKRERQTADELATVRGRIYPMMGLAGGVSLALLLM